MTSTAPVSKIVGSFTIDRIETGSPDEIWASFGKVGVIGEEDFFAYYGDSGSAVAIVVSDAERFDVPVPLDSMQPRPAVPQSFAYLPAVDLLPV